VRILKLSSVSIHEAGISSTSRGLVGDTVFAVLPNVKPIHTFLITLLFQAVGAFYYELAILLAYDIISSRSSS
jgi:hypothetical protein